MSTATRGMLKCCALIMEKAKIKKEVRKSSPSMMVLRLTRSARTPPKGESRIVGRMETARIVAKMEALPLTFNTYRESEKRRIALPNREMICPMIMSLKL